MRVRGRRSTKEPVREEVAVQGRSGGSDSARARERSEVSDKRDKRRVRGEGGWCIERIVVVL